MPPKDHGHEGQKHGWTAREGKERSSGKAQKEFWEVERATAKDTRAQGKTCGPTWGGWTKGQGKGLHLWGTDESFDSSVGFPATSPSLFHIEASTASQDSFLPKISVLSTRLPIKTHNPFEILTEGTDDDDTVDDSIPLVLTNSHHRCGERTWPKGSHKRKTKFVRFHEDPCDLVNDEANNLNFLGSHDCSDINHIDNAKGWIRVTAIMESGAAESVAPFGLRQEYSFERF